MSTKYYVSLLVIILALASCGASQSTPLGSGATATSEKVTPHTSGKVTSQWLFDSDPRGGLPAGAEVFSGNWVVRAESDAPTSPNALCQTGQATFHALSLSPATYTDLAVSVRFKPISGAVDQAAGIIFRIQDKNNYYIVRANALENNVDIFKYSGGVRSLIQEGSATVVSGKWQELRIEAIGNSIRGYLNNQQVVKANDESFKTGKIGLWTKADSVTCFDNVQLFVL